MEITNWAVVETAKGKLLLVGDRCDRPTDVRLHINMSCLQFDRPAKHRSPQLYVHFVGGGKGKGKKGRKIGAEPLELIAPDPVFAATVPGMSLNDLAIFSDEFIMCYLEGDA